MKRTASLIALALMFVFSPLIAAQQQSSAEDILRWFPEGQYQKINHRDNTMLRSGSAYALYVKYFEPELAPSDEGKENEPKRLTKFAMPGSGQLLSGRLLLNKDLKLPPSLRDAVTTATDAAVVMLTEEEERDNRARKEARPHIRKYISAGGPAPLFALVALTPNMAVYRLDDLAASLANALARNEIAETGHLFDGRPVYSFSTSGVDTKSELYAWGDELGELLVAENLEMLHKMILAGTGKTTTILDDPEYVDLVTTIPELGAKWTAEMPMSLVVPVGNRRTSEDESVEERMRYLRKVNGGVPIQTLRIGNMTVSDVLVSQSYAFYAESDAAEEAYNDSRNWAFGQVLVDGKPLLGFSEYEKTFNERRKTELHGSTVISTVLYDEKLLLSEYKAQEELTLARQKKGSTLSFTNPDGRSSEPKKIGTPGVPADGKQKKGSGKK